jgi:hypothetical protein
MQIERPRTPNKVEAANSTRQTRVSTEPVTAKVGNGGPAFCDPQGHCTPAAAPAPSAPSSLTNSSSCGGLSVGPGATAIGEESCGQGNPPSSSTANAAPTNQPQPGASTHAPSVAPWFDVFANEINPLPSAEAEDKTAPQGEFHCNDGRIVWSINDCLVRPQSSPSATAGQSQGAPPAPQQTQIATASQNYLSDVRLPLQPKDLEAKINKCNTGKCSCSSFPDPPGPVPVVRSYPICDKKCGLDTECFRDCGIQWSTYNDDANAYNRLFIQACPNYSAN